MRRESLIALSLGLLLPLAATAGQAPTLTVGSAAGTRGEVVALTVSLSGDAASAAVTADLDLAFPDDLVRFLLPVKERCILDPRLAQTHQVGGTLVGDGLVQLAIFDAEAPLAPLGDGLLVTCEVEILPGAERSPAALIAEFATIGDARGQLLAVTPVDGAVVITDLPQACIADCNGDGTVTVDEAVRAVAIALGNQPVGNCPVADRDGNGQVTIEELIDAVKDVIGGC